MNKVEYFGGLEDRKDIKSMMKDLEFVGQFGDEAKTVKIVQPYLSGDVYQVLIENYYQSIIMRLGGEWVAYWNSRSSLGADDVSIIGQIIESKVN